MVLLDNYLKWSSFLICPLRQNTCYTIIQNFLKIDTIFLSSIRTEILAHVLYYVVVVVVWKGVLYLKVQLVQNPAINQAGFYNVVIHLYEFKYTLVFPRKLRNKFSFSNID